MCKPNCCNKNNTTPKYATVAPYLPKALQTILYASQEFLHSSTSACDLVITLDLPGAPYHFQRGAEYIDAGKRAAQNRLPEIVKMVGKDRVETLR